MQDNELVKILKNRQDGNCMDWPEESMFYVFYANMVQDYRLVEALRRSLVIQLANLDKASTSSASRFLAAVNPANRQSCLQ